MRKVKKVVITGGPHGGKTTVFKALMEKYEGQILFVPEVATVLLTGIFPQPGKDLELTPHWLRHFQKAVIPVQRSAEAIYEQWAEERGIKLLLMDRGAFDSKAYLPAEDNLADFGLELKEAGEWYDHVFHLESLAVFHPELYGKTGNECRYETVEQAVALDGRIQAAWAHHPAHTVLSGYGLTQKIETISEIIEEVLRG